MEILAQLLNKTMGHLQDALKFTLAIPRKDPRIRLFCIWPLWMAVETVAVLHNNRELLKSDDPVKISRKTVRQILRRTQFLCYSDTLLKLSFERIQKRDTGFMRCELCPPGMTGRARLDLLGSRPH